VGGDRFSWEVTGSRGRQQVLMGVSKFSWEAASTRESQQVLMGVSRLPSGEDSAVLISVGYWNQAHENEATFMAE
jgi:hypothetical protein